jgi:hypothetical protein
MNCMTWMTVGTFLVTGLAIGCATGVEPVAQDDSDSWGEAVEAKAEPIGFGEVKIAAFGCAPVCTAIGSKSEGWRDGCSGQLIKWAQCADQAAYCGALGSWSEGWYSTSGERIKYAWCSEPAKYNQVRTYTFQGKAGQVIDLYVDGLFERGIAGEPGLDTRARLYRGSKKIATSDDTTQPGWILRLNKVANENSSDLHMALPGDGEYRLVVTSKGNRQGSAEVVVKTPDVDFCAKADDFDAATQTTFFGARNFDNQADAQLWLTQAWPTADHTSIVPLPCDEPMVCGDVYAPVCAQTGQGTNLQFSNDCEFRQAVLSDAGGETPQESKGKYVPGECVDVDLCAVATVSWPGNTDTYVYVKNFNDASEANAWFSEMPTLGTIIKDGPCDKPTMCQMFYSPVCGQVLNEAPQTYSNECAFKSAVGMTAGDEYPLESKGFFHKGPCQ